MINFDKTLVMFKLCTLLYSISTTLRVLLSLLCTQITFEFHWPDKKIDEIST